MAICGIGTMAVRRKWGRKLFCRFLFITLLLTSASMLFSAVAFSLHYYDAPMTDTKFASVLDFFLQIFPNDVLSPVISGDSPQLILVALIVGNAILAAGNQSEGLVSFMEQVNTVVLIIAEWAEGSLRFLSRSFLFLVSGMDRPKSWPSSGSRSCCSWQAGLYGSP